MNKAPEDQHKGLNGELENYRFEKALAEEKLTKEDSKEKNMKRVYEGLLREIFKREGFAVQINTWGRSSNPSQININIYDPRESNRLYATITRQPYFVKQEKRTPKGVIGEMEINNALNPAEYLRLRGTAYEFASLYKKIFNEEFLIKR